MSPLLRKPFGSHGKIHEITPQSAGWRYVGFSVYRLRPGEAVEEATGDREVILVMVEGKAAIHAAGQDWGMLGDRMNVFEKTPPHCLYVPNAAIGGRSRTRSARLPFVRRPERAAMPRGGSVPREFRSRSAVRGPTRRHINNIAMEAEDYCDSLLVTEVFTPAGHWSSYPSHRHDEDDFPRITYLEETYYHRLHPASASASSGSIPIMGSSMKPWR